MKEALDLFFELSSDERLGILSALQDMPAKLTQLSNHLKLHNQEVSRQLARLTALDLCYRDGEGKYNLTPYAQHVIRLVPGFGFLSKNRSFFRTHTAMGLPLNLQLRIGELAECMPLTDILAGIYDTQQMVLNSSEYLWFIIEQGNVAISQVIEEAIKRGVKYRVIVPSNLVPSKPYLEYLRSWGPDHPLRSENVERRYLDKPPIGLSLSEKEAPQILFPTLEGSLDYTGFKAAGEEAHRWCRDVFMFYWEKASKEMPKRLRRILEAE